MKKVTESQMKKLKGKLNDMNYDPLDPNNVAPVVPPQPQTQTDICKVKHWTGDVN